MPHQSDLPRISLVQLCDPFLWWRLVLWRQRWCPVLRWWWRLVLVLVSVLVFARIFISRIFTSSCLPFLFVLPLLFGGGARLIFWILFPSIFWILFPSMGWGFIVRGNELARENILVHLAVYQHMDEHYVIPTSPPPPFGKKGEFGGPVAFPVPPPFVSKIA